MQLPTAAEAENAAAEAEDAAAGLQIEEVKDPWTLVESKLEGWYEGLIKLLPNLAVALLILVLFWYLAKVIRKLISRLLGRVSTHASLNNLAATMGGVIVILVGGFIALEIVGLDRAVTSLLAGAGVIGLALAFAFQSITANLMSGVLITLRRPFEISDIIKTNDHFGTVNEINLRSTVLHSPEGQVVIIPNKEVFETPLVNYTQLGRRRIDLRCGVSYGDDLEKAKRVAMEAVEGLDGLVEGRKIELFYEEFGDSSINFVIRFWIDFSRQPDFLEARSEAVIRIKRAFDDADVSIPFPIRTLDFGIRGGERLREHLSGAGNGGGDSPA